MEKYMCLMNSDQPNGLQISLVASPYREEDGTTQQNLQLIINIRWVMSFKQVLLIQDFLCVGARSKKKKRIEKKKIKDI